MSDATILIADDSLEMLEFYASVLFDFDIDYVPNGALLIEAALSKPYRLIITDLVMPDITGAEATKRIRSTPGPNQNTSIYGCTGDSTEEGAAEMRGAGFDHWFKKPAPLEFLRRLCHWASDPDLPVFVRPMD